MDGRPHYLGVPMAMNPRPSRMPRALLVVLVVALVLPLAAIVPAGAVDLDGARSRVADLEDDLATLTARFEATWAQVEQATVELDDLEREADALAAEAAALEVVLADRARQAFVQGTATDLAVLLSGDGPDVSLQRASLLARVNDRGTVSIEQAAAVRIALGQAQALVVEQRAELEVLTEQLAADQQALEAELEAAQARVRSLEVIAARQRTIDRGGQRGVYACPLDRHLTHFIDSWGFPRSGGRRHQGTDIMGPMGAPVYAFTAGVISRHSNSRLGGISLYLRGDDGSTYFYAHLQGYAPRGAVGTRVRAGELIAYNGNTGNARGGPAHIHFERHPGGGAPVNPYPWLAAACF